ncbi:MAG: chemotaxis protein CheW [bacterium]|nr:chemotaxis protein CheW [bacterium]
MSNVPAVVETAIESQVQQITFYVGEEVFGVDIMCVEEIITPKKPTAIPRTPAYFMGIINLRGEVISIIDMRRRFQMEPKGQDEQSRVIVIYSQGCKLGMLVDSISRIVTLNNSSIQGASKFVSSEKQKYISGSYRLDDDEILLLLDHEALIDEEDFYIHHEVTAANEHLKAKEEVVVEVSPELFLVGFAIGRERFAIQSIQVEEIIQMPEITPVPEMDSFVEGIFHLRESVIPVIRLGQRMAVKSQKEIEEPPVIIVRIEGIKVGLIVDMITEVYLIKESEITEPPITLNAKQLDQLRGVIKLEREGKTQIVMLLKLEKLFSFEEQDQLKDLEDSQVEIEDEGEREEEVPILEFMLAGEKYAIEVATANEIIPVREVVPVPKSPEFIRGVINLRGDVISVVDLPLLVENVGYEFTPDTKILIVDTGAEVAGLVVEKVVGIRKVLLSTFEPPSELLSQRGNIFIRGMSKDVGSDDIVVLMDLNNTLIQAQGLGADGSGSDALLGVQAELEQLEAEERRQIGHG